MGRWRWVTPTKDIDGEVMMVL
ncbi:hypothetical protein M8C21_023329 [Ambrosia artemisiifolia]|uniref:Uncharacterized protein n=1 Tax=Ambrosia artemisiifolia TaxID=4212 RepID=A0AAD5G9X9_AMBAR|nr:hypothetical protein M8C21_023329 [Ambrosia artemisiifolia]